MQPAQELTLGVRSDTHLITNESGEPSRPRGDERFFLAAAGTMCLVVIAGFTNLLL